MFNPLSYKGFLQVGGVVLILVGLLSFVLPGGALIGETWWFDTTEGYAHLLLGVVAIAAAYVLPANLQKPLVVVVGVVALFFGVYGFTLPTGSMTKYNLGVANLENPLDNILHLFVAAWALYTSLVSKATPESKMM
jgi:hypothetical protein